MNGVVLEVGRKIKTPEKESEGVLTYSSMLGPNKAALLWLVMLLSTLVLSIAASYYAGYGWMAFFILSGVFAVCALPAFVFLKKKTNGISKMIELSSALWTVMMYLSLGGIPMLIELLS